MKLAFKLAGIVAAAFFVVAALSSAREWFILYHFDDYKPCDFVIETARREVIGETECLLSGRIDAEKIEFRISAARYEQFSANDVAGTKLRIWRNGMMPDISDITFQQESLKVFLDDDWRPRDELSHSAVSTSFVAGISLAFAVLLFWLGSRRKSSAIVELDDV